VVKTEYREQVLHQIASNSTYICYGLKQGHIRVLNKETTARTLLKGHSCMVVDMRFFSASSNILASCDSGGEVFVRRITEDASEEGGASASQPSDPIQEDLLAHHKFSFSAPSSATRRLAWHPQLESLLAVALDDRVALINVPPSSGVAKSAEFANPIVPAGPMVSAPVTCLAFSDRGDLLAVSDASGRVSVWALPPDLVSQQQYEPLPTTPDLVFEAFTPAEPATCIEFLPSGNGRAVLVAGNASARTLALWVVSAGGEGGEGGLTAARTYTLELTSSKDGPAAFFNHLLVQPNFSVVVLANTKKQQVYVLHAHQDAAAGTASFDYLSLFEVKMPILSMTTITEDAVGADVFHLYCVQTEAIQEYTLYPTTCFPASDMEEEAERQLQLELEASQPLQDVTPVLPPTVHTPLGGLTPAELRTLPESSSREPPVAAPPKPAPAPVLVAEPEPQAIEPSSTGTLLDDVVALATGTTIKPLAAAPTEPSAATMGTPPHRVSVPGSSGGDSVTSDAASPGPAGAAPPALAAESSSGSTGIPASASPAPPPPPARIPSPVPELVEASPAPAPTPAAPQQPRASSHSPAPPPQPSLLLRKMSNSASAAQPSAPASTPTGDVPSAPAAATAALQTAVPGLDVRVAPGAAVAAGAAGSGEVSAATLALIMEQVAASQRETVRQVRADLKAELKAQAKASEAATAKAVEAALKAQEKRDREELSRTLNTAVAAISRDVGAKVADAVKALPAQVAAAAKAAVAEALPAATQAAVEKAVATQLRTALPQAVQAAFASTVLPSFERATASMFGQIDAAFKGGLAAAISTASGANAQAAAGIADTSKQLSTLVGALRTEVAALSAARAADASARSAAPASAVAPAAPVAKDPKAVAAAHLAAKQYDEAFDAVLSSNSQEALVWLLRQLSPNSLLGQEPCPLSQIVMLSLLSNLGHNLGGADVDTRLSWIQEVAACIDPHHPQAAPHLKAVLAPIKEALAGLAKTGSGDTQRVARMAVHVVNSLLHQ